MGGLVAGQTAGCLIGSIHPTFLSRPLDTLRLYQSLVTRVSHADLYQLELANVHKMNALTVNLCTSIKSNWYYFYSKTENEYGCFSNFALYGFYLEGEHWKTVEHYFQGQKFLDEAQRKRVAFATTPKEAKRLGRQHGLREGWDDMRDEVMRRGVLAKFTANANLRALLLATGEEELIEASPHDYYWGCGAKGTGKNCLGQILMETRTILRNQA